MIDKHKKSEYARAYYQRHKEEIKAKVRAWADENSHIKKAADREYYKKNSESIKERSRKNYHLTKEDRLEKKKEWARNNADRKNATNKRWLDKNKHLRAHYAATRRVSKRMATPKWVCEEHMFAIKEAYQIAKLRTAVTGIKWHVDHIVPIKGKMVCGLHVIENLQVIPAVDNIRKSNKFEV